MTCATTPTSRPSSRRLRTPRRRRFRGWRWVRALSVVGALLGGSGSALASEPAAGSPEEEREAAVTERFALVIGNNTTLDADQVPLRFADDDAVRMAELLEELGAHVELVTTLDRDSQRTFDRWVDRTSRPTLETIRRVHQGLVERMDEARARGAEVEFMLFYSGHGDVGADGQGYLTLEGEKLTRSELFSGLLTASTADVNHIIIDACRSESFVLSRGSSDWKNDRAGLDASEAVAAVLDRNHLGAFPNTGVILAHSSDQQTHEWERYRGGIFSHEVLSGLRGGADLDGNGRIEYSELGAFVAAANSAVQDPRAKLQVVVRPPKVDERHPLVEHRSLGESRLLFFPRGDAALYTLEDERGVRLADLRRADASPGYLRLPPGAVFVHRVDGDAREESVLSVERTGLVPVGSLSFEPERGASRGALDAAFRRGLFSTPYGPGYYRGYTDRTGLLPVDGDHWGEPPWVRAPAPRVQDPPSDVVKHEPQHEPGLEEEDERKPSWAESRTWGAVFFGTVVTPFDPAGRIDLGSKRVTANRFRGCLDPYDQEACSALRGFDLRWQLFWVKSRSNYPRFSVHFRTGYTSGHADFEPEDGAGFTEAGQARSLSYFAVPLFVGGSVYVFDKFPVRPFAGLGTGFDVIRLDYRRFNADDKADVSGRIGFELHAGIEGRITNYVSLTAQVMQLWSLRRKLSNLPDFSNESFTIITGIAIGFPLDRR